MKKIQAVGHVAIGSRLRHLSQRIDQDAAALFKIYGVSLKPKWWPVFYVLSQDGSSSITRIATDIGHSHPSVVKLVTEMKRAGIVGSRPDPVDGRRSLLSLTPAGEAIRDNIQVQYADVGAAIADMLASTNHDLLRAMDEMEYLLDQQSMMDRVMERKKRREGKTVRIVPYEPTYKTAFKRLNQRWIEAFFRMEEADHHALDFPQPYILDPGGDIRVALLAGKVVGVCALLKIDHPRYDFELAKMAVDPDAQGKGVGELLGRAILTRAGELGARVVYLESSTKLTPALRLYEKLGFKKVRGIDSPYERCDIQMEVVLQDATA